MEGSNSHDEDFGIVVQGCGAFALQLHMCNTSLKEEKNGLAYKSLGREGHLLLILVDFNMKLIFAFSIIFFINFDQKSCDILHLVEKLSVLLCVNM
jgi:hypothetical protein